MELLPFTYGQVRIVTPRDRRLHLVSTVVCSTLDSGSTRLQEDARSTSTESVTDKEIASILLKTVSQLVLKVRYQQSVHVHCMMTCMLFYTLCIHREYLSTTERRRPLPCSLFEILLQPGDRTVRRFPIQRLLWQREQLQDDRTV